MTFEKGKAYTLELSIDSLSEATTLTLYGTQDKNSKTEAVVNGQALAADVCYGLFQVKE